MTATIPIVSVVEAPQAGGESLEHVLLAAGYRVTFAHSPEAAFEALRQPSLEAVIVHRVDGEDITVESMEVVERRHIQRTLLAVRGNKTRAARLLGFDRSTLYRKLRQYGLE